MGRAWLTRRRPETLPAGRREDGRSGPEGRKTEAMLAPVAMSRLGRFAAGVDRAAPGRLAGLYAVGSLALGDWRNRSSNLDVLSVADEAWEPNVVRRLRRAVAGLEVHGRAARVAFITWADLANDPAAAKGPVLVGRRSAGPAELNNPMTWQILRVSAICVRGPEYPDIWSGDVRDWAEERIVEWWPAQMDRWRRQPGSLWFRRQTSAVALDLARLSVTAASGRVVSKLEAGEALIDSVGSRSQRLLKDSVGYRQGSRLSMYYGPFERKNDTVNWIASVVAQQQSHGENKR